MIVGNPEFCVTGCVESGEGASGNDVVAPRDFARAGVDVEKLGTGCEISVFLRFANGRASKSSEALVAFECDNN